VRDHHHSRLEARGAFAPGKPGVLKGKLFCTPDAFTPLMDADMEELGFE
jgi:hypothetical protein